MTKKATNPIDSDFRGAMQAGMHPAGYEITTDPMREKINAALEERILDSIIQGGRGAVPCPKSTLPAPFIIRDLRGAMMLVFPEEQLRIIIKADFSPELVQAIYHWHNANVNLLEAIANEKPPFQRFRIRLAARLKSFGRRLKKEKTRKEPRP